jgi:hypothetical protein
MPPRIGISVAIWVLGGLAEIGSFAACRGAATDEGPCRCTPGNASTTRAVGEAAPMDGPALVDRLRRHRRLVDGPSHRPAAVLRGPAEPGLVEEGRNPRDVKVFDDELRHAILGFCQPCGAWVGERLTMEEMFPLQRLPDATSAVCMGLVLRDGSIAYGDARPHACR